MTKESFKLLDIRDFIPINIKENKAKWEKIFNVPNNRWVQIEEHINIINNENLPVTLRIFLLNNLPYSVIKQLQSQSEWLRELQIRQFPK